MAAKSVTLSYVVVTDDENHENHEIMCDMSTPKWTPPWSVTAKTVLLLRFVQGAKNETRWLVT